MDIRIMFFNPSPRIVCMSYVEFIGRRGINYVDIKVHTLIYKNLATLTKYAT